MLWDFAFFCRTILHGSTFRGNLVSDLVSEFNSELASFPGKIQVVPNSDISAIPVFLTLAFYPLGH